MASPTVANRTESSLTTAATTFTINFTQTTGDLVMVLAALAAGEASPSWSDSFSTFTTGFSTYLGAYKVLDGSEGGNVVLTMASQKACAVAYNIQGSDGNAPERGTTATGTSVNPDPGNCAPAGGTKDYLFIASFRQAGEEADDDTWCTGFPTNYSNLLQTTSGTGGAASTNCQMASCERALTASSDDAGAFTTVQSLSWNAMTHAIYPAAAAERVPHFSSYPQLLAH